MVYRQTKEGYRRTGNKLVALIDMASVRRQLGQAGVVPRIGAR